MVDAIGPVELRVAPLDRSVLDGVVDPNDETRRIDVDLGVVPVFEDERPLKGLAGLLDWRLRGRLSNMLRSGWCTGRAGEAVLLPLPASMPVGRLVLLGMGPFRGFEPQAAQAAARSAVRRTIRLRPRSVLFAMPAWVQDRAVIEAVFMALVEALAETPAADLRLPDPPFQQDTGPAGDAPELSAPGQSMSLVECAPAEVPLTGPALVSQPANDANSGLGDGGEPPMQATPLVRPAGREVAVAWWVLAAARHVARLRRLLDGPPRAADA